MSFIKTVALSCLFQATECLIHSEKGSYSAITYLHTQDLQNYSKDIRPFSNHTDPIEVSVNVMPKAIIKWGSAYVFVLQLSWSDAI